MSELEPRIIKSATCPSLSGRSTLTYEVAHAGSAIYLRLTGNTGAGIYSKDWIGLSQIAQDETPITAKKLKDTFKSKSVNTVCFAIAALIAEGLLKVSEGSLRSYVRVPEYQKILKAYIDTEAVTEKKSAKKKSEPSNEETP
jgi:hypothetical protein